MFIAQALQRVVNVVRDDIINTFCAITLRRAAIAICSAHKLLTTDSKSWMMCLLYTLHFFLCMQQSFPKLQLEVNVIVLENGGSGAYVSGRTTATA